MSLASDGYLTGIVKMLPSGDGSRRVVIRERSDGHFEIYEQRWWPAFEYPPAPPIPAYWSIVPVRSGIYGSFEIAMREARALYPWAFIDAEH